MDGREQLPLVSVLIPAYNHQDFVKETINSIVQQTYQNIEILILDDGSTDLTYQRMNEMKEVCENRFVRSFFLTQSNQGTSCTLNKLISLAQGEYVYLIASDDIAKESAIEALYEEMKSNQYVLVVGDNDLIDHNSHLIGWDDVRNSVPLKQAKYTTFVEFLRSTRSNKKLFLEEFGTYSSLLEGNYIPNGYLMSKQAIQKVGGYTKEAPLEDFYMHLQLSKAGKFKFLNKVLFSYRWHESNIIKKTQLIKELSQKTFNYEVNQVFSGQDRSLINTVRQAQVRRFLLKIKLAILIRLSFVRNLLLKLMSNKSCS